MFDIFNSYLDKQLFSLDTKKIKNKILNLKSKDKGRIVSNYGGWQSKSIEKIDKNFESLFNKISLSVKKIEKHLLLSKELKLINLWYNVNGLGSFNRPHNHLGSVVSGVYYISIPKNSGNLIFLNQNLDNFYKSIKQYNKYNSTIWSVEPENNLCLLFPSYLIHYVEPNLNKEERISISFNYGF
jgi:uncharacterized protein (TIGR02466 family)